MMHDVFKKLTTLVLLVCFLFSGFTPAFAGEVEVASRGNGILIEHLPMQKDASVNSVAVSNSGITILANNVLPVSFAHNFSTKQLGVGDKIIFVLDYGLSTVEGRVIFPASTQIVAEVQCVQKPQWWNKNARVELFFKCLVLPDGTVIPFKARVFTPDSQLHKSKWASAGKVSAYTVGLFGVGAGLGAAIGAAANAASVGCLAIGMPVGGGVGLLLGLATPGLHYKAKAGQVILIQLIEDLSVCCSTCSCP